MDLTETSKQRLGTVIPELREIIIEAIEKAEALGMTVQITEGRRTLAAQKHYVEIGKSKTMKSYHLTGRAVDVYVNKGWKFEHYKQFADIVKAVAIKKQKIITWGGDWPKFRDGPHFQIEHV